MLSDAQKTSARDKQYLVGWFGITVGALILFRILLFVYFVISNGQYVHPDTAVYIELASGLLEKGIFYLPHNQPEIIQPFGIPSEFSGRVLQSSPPAGPEVFRTPGYPAFLAGLAWLGLSNPYAIVFCQELIYGLSVFIFFKYGRSCFTNQIVRFGVIFMLLEPGGLAWPKYLLSETLFLPFLLGSLLGLGFYLKKSDWRFLVLAGTLMGMGVWVRPAMLYFPYVAALTIILFNFRNKQSWLHAGGMLLVFLLMISPWLIRNYIHYDKLFLSGQSSNMFANYHVPMVWNWEHIIGYYEGQDLVQIKIAEVVKEKEAQLGRSINAVEYYQVQQAYAFQELRKYPVTYITHWINGVVKVMYESFVIDLYDVLRIPDRRAHFFELVAENIKPGRANFFAIETSGLLSNIGSYLIKQDKIYLINSVFAFLMFLFAIPGAIKILFSKNCFLLLMMLVNFYFIFLPGPMGYGRFRFPVGIFWFVQAYIGLMWCYAVLNKVCTTAVNAGNKGSLVGVEQKVKK